MSNVKAILVQELGHFIYLIEAKRFEGCYLCKKNCRIQNCTSDKAEPVHKVRNLHLLKQRCEESRPSNLGVGAKINDHILVNTGMINTK